MSDRVIREKTFEIVKMCQDKFEGKTPKEVGALMPIVSGITASLVTDQGEQYLIDIQEGLMNLIRLHLLIPQDTKVEMLRGTKVEMLRGTLDYTEIRAKFKELVDLADDTALKFLLLKANQILDVGFDGDVLEALYLTVAFRSLIAYLYVALRNIRISESQN